MAKKRRLEYVVVPYEVFKERLKRKEAESERVYTAGSPGVGSSPASLEAYKDEQFLKLFRTETGLADDASEADIRKQLFYMCQIYLDKSEFSESTPTWDIVRMLRKKLKD